MPYLIDSDWVIDFLAQESEALQLIEQLAQEGIAISIVTYMEVYQGVLRSQESEAGIGTVRSPRCSSTSPAILSRRGGAMRG